MYLSDKDIVLFVATAKPAIAGMNTSALNNTIIASRTGYTSVNIYCTASGDADSVSFHWTLNGGTVPNSYASATNSGEHVIGQLHISPVTPAHGGTYRCFSNNLVGSDQQNLTLRVVGMYGGILFGIKCKR